MDRQMDRVGEIKQVRLGRRQPEIIRQHIACGGPTSNNHLQHKSASVSLVFHILLFKCVSMNGLSAQGLICSVVCISFLHFCPQPTMVQHCAFAVLFHVANVVLCARISRQKLNVSNCNVLSLVLSHEVTRDCYKSVNTPLFVINNNMLLELRRFTLIHLIRIGQNYSINSTKDV